MSKSKLDLFIASEFHQYAWYKTPKWQKHTSMPYFRYSWKKLKWVDVNDEVFSLDHFRNI